MLLNIFLADITTVFLLYTDPGSGALLLQLLIASLFGGLFYIRRFKEKVFRMFFAKRLVENEENSYLSEKTN
jgi:hypothetical protein